MSKRQETVKAKEIEQILSEVNKDKVAIEDMPLETLRDYRLYNEEARKLNHKLGICRYKIKPCPVALHPHQRIKFTRRDQPSNPLAVYKSDDKIHFEKTLIPGKEYDLPEYIIHYLGEKGYPVWKWVDLPNGERETQISHNDPRFSLQHVYSS